MVDVNLGPDNKTSIVLISNNNTFYLIPGNNNNEDCVKYDSLISHSFNEKKYLKTYPIKLNTIIKSDHCKMIKSY